MLAPKYYLPLDSLSTKPNNRYLIIDDMAIIEFFGIDFAIANCFNFILLVVSIFLKF